jgi:hypothetical protein
MAELDIYQVAKDIQKNESDLEDLRLLARSAVKEFKAAGTPMVNSDVEYKKQIGIAIVKLFNGVEMELAGMKVQKPPATIMIKIAEAICSDYQLKRDTAAALYDAAKSKVCGLNEEMKNVESQLTGNQSLFKSFEQMIRTRQ